MTTSTTPLKLRGRSLPDIVTLSGLVQDSLIAPNEMTVEADKRRFVAIINRFMWERVDTNANQGSNSAEDQDAKFEDASDGRFWRVQAALVIERANNVRRKGMAPQSSKNALGGQALHYLLGIVPDDGFVTLFFAGGGMIRVEGPALEVFLEDLSEPWPTPQMPVHPDSEEALD